MYILLQIQEREKHYIMLQIQERVLRLGVTNLESPSWNMASFLWSNERAPRPIVSLGRNRNFCDCTLRRTSNLNRL